MDLLGATAALVDIASPSRGEGALADHVEGRLRACPGLEVHRIADNVVARAGMGPGRVLLAGHLDTVPADGNDRSRLDGDVCWGLGAADMKGGLAVMLGLAESPPALRCPVTWVFYAAEEVARSDSGLLQVAAARPDLLEAEVAVLGEPTGGVVEAGCQGTLRLRVALGGRRAHTARPWMGVNAVHRLGPLLGAVASAPARRPVIDGCEYREALVAVAVEGGVAGNVVPDRAVVTLAHRHAPDRATEAAEAWVRELLAPHLDPELGDAVELVDAAPAAPPGLGHPVIAALVAATGQAPRAKLGWTDVAFFAERGIPAANLGPGDPELAHTAAERVSRGELEAVDRVLRRLLGPRGGA